MSDTMQFDFSLVHKDDLKRIVDTTIDLSFRKLSGCAIKCIKCGQWGYFGSNLIQHGFVNKYSICGWCGHIEPLKELGGRE